MTDRYSSYNKLKFDFSAGGDFGLIEKMTGNLDEIMTTWKEAKDFVYNIINCNKPIISAINGLAAGTGWSSVYWPIFLLRVSARKLSMAIPDWVLRSVMWPQSSGHSFAARQKPNIIY